MRKGRIEFLLNFMTSILWTLVNVASDYSFCISMSLWITCLLLHIIIFMYYIVFHLYLTIIKMPTVTMSVQNQSCYSLQCHLALRPMPPGSVGLRMPHLFTWYLVFNGFINSISFCHTAIVGYTISIRKIIFLLLYSSFNGCINSISVCPAGIAGNSWHDLPFVA